jgi:hypothetical protein
VEPEPFLYVVRYCGEQDSSTAAAIRDAVMRLDAHLAEVGATAPGDLIVLYRTQVPHTLRLDIGFPVSAEVAGTAAGDVHRGATPGGTMLWKMPAAGLSGIVTAARGLRSASGAELVWQRFPASEFRPWLGHRPARVFAPALPSSVHAP